MKKHWIEAGYLILILSIFGCTIFNRTEVNDDKNKTTVSGTVIFPLSTVVANLGTIRGAVDFSRITICINGKDYGKPDSNGNYSFNQVPVASYYTVEAKNINKITVLMAFSLSSGVVHLNSTTTAIALVYFESFRRNPNITINSVSATSLSVQNVVAAIENALANLGTLSQLTVGATSIFGIPTITTAVESAANTIVSTTTTTTSSTGTTFTSSSTSSSTGGPSQASDYSPADKATGVSTGVKMTWKVASGSLSTVYFGTSASPTLAVMTASSSTSYKSSVALVGSTTYFWRVDTSLNSQTTKGKEARFTTKNGAPVISTLSSLRSGPFSVKLNLGFTDDSSATGDKVTSFTAKIARMASGTNSITLTTFNATTSVTLSRSPNALSDSFTFYNLKPGAQYFVLIQAYDKAGNLGSNSLKIASFPTAGVFKLTGFQAATAATGKATFTFGINDEITSFTLTIASGTTAQNPGQASFTLKKGGFASVTTLATSTLSLDAGRKYTTKIWVQHGANILASSQPYFTAQ